MHDVSQLTVSELLALHAKIGEALRQKNVVRSANNPVGDLTEFLFCQAFGWVQAHNSEKGYDATDGSGIRYQIKGRRLHDRNKSRQLSALRDLKNGHFDVLAAALLHDNYQVAKAALIPIEIVQSRSRFSNHTNSSIFMLTDDIWHLSGVVDVTDAVANAMP